MVGNTPRSRPRQAGMELAEDIFLGGLWDSSDFWVLGINLLVLSGEEGDLIL